jgi:hypothetical protein
LNKLTRSNTLAWQVPGAGLLAYNFFRAFQDMRLVLVPVRFRAHMQPPSHFPQQTRQQPAFRGTSLAGKRNPLGPYRRPMPRVLGYLSTL